MYRPQLKGLTARLVLGALLGLSPIAGYPLGLGKLKVRSALNEPLKAEIDFTSIADSERRGLNISIAPRADFEAAGAERLPFLSQIKFQVAQRSDGQYYLELKTDQPIEEPFLHMLLQLEWQGGRLVREYTALIDPPSFMVSKPAQVEAPSIVPPTPVPVPEVPAPTAQAPAATPFVETVPPPTEAAPAAPKAEAPVAEATPAPAAAPVAEAGEASEQVPLITLSQDPTVGSPDSFGVSPLDPIPPEVPVAQAPATTEAAGSQALAQPEPLPEPAKAAAPVTPQTNDYTVRAGDTAFSIAERVRGDHPALSLEQIVVAIFKNNREAFYRDNLNNLRAGKVLKIPEREAMEQASVPDARREFKAQYDAWQEYKLKLAAGSRTLKVADEPVAAAAEKTAPVAAATQEAPKKPTESQPRKPSSDELLKIVRNPNGAQSTAPAKGAGAEAPKEVERRERAALADRATTLEESLESKQLENRELSEKIGQVRQQIKNEKRLMELESQALAKQTQPTAETKPAAQAPEAPKPAPKPAETPKAVEPKPAEAAKAPEATKPAETPAAPATPAEPPKRVARAPKAPAAPVPPPEEEKSFITSLTDDLLGDSTIPVVGGVLALLGGGILIVYLRRRQRSIAEFEESILASDAVANTETPTSPGDTTGQAVTTGDTSFLSDFSKAGMGHMQTDEVDPIAEAEVYLAYGRDETAEEILKEAVVKNPDRHELKQKLLEIYHQRNDANAFETLAEELYAALGGRGGKMWEKIEEMGRKLNPENPMFRGGAPEPAAARRATDKPAPTPTPAPAMADALEFTPTMVAAAPAAHAPTQVIESSSDGGIDFEAPVSSEVSADAGLDFDLGETANADEPIAKTQVASADDLGGLDFGSDLAEPAASADDNVINFESVKMEPASDAGDDLTAVPIAGGDDDIKWDLESPVVDAAAEETNVAGSGGQEAHWDETATKLDLAKAYIDMGDADGARSILDEVLAEGNDQQKKQAAELAAQIA